MPKASIEKDFNDFVKRYLKKEFLKKLPKNENFKDSDLQIIFVKNKDKSCNISFKVKNDVYEMNHLNYIFGLIYEENNLEKMKNIFLNEYRIFFQYDYQKDVLQAIYKQKIYEFSINDVPEDDNFVKFEEIVKRKLTSNEKECCLKNLEVLRTCVFLNEVAEDGIKNFH